MSASIRTVELNRASGGFGFTLSSQGPCVLSCILASSPAHKAGLKPGDQILYVNGASVERFPHEQVVKLIARSLDGRVNLGVRNRVLDSAGKPTANTSTSQHQETPEEAAVNNAILNRVDKVVEELKSGQLLVNTPAAIRRSLSSTTDGVTSISEDDIVSDEDLKASFSESVFIDSPSDSVFSDNIFNNESRRSSDAEIVATKLSRVLYPALTPVRSASSMPLQHDNIKADFRAIVGYLGSIELPASSSLQTASLNAIRGCVRRLRAQQKVHLMFLLEVSVVGVQLIDSGNRIVVTYPIKSLAFTGICSDDNKVFGIVTRQSNVSSRRNSWHSNHPSLDSQSTVNCSCHVFSVDSDLALHETHITTARKFNIKCTTGSVDCECMEFQDSALPILHAISSLFRERTGSELGMDEIRTRSRSLSSSQSKSSASSIDRPIQANVQYHNATGENSYKQDSKMQELDIDNKTSKPRPNIRVRVTDGGTKYERSNSDPEIHDEPFRHRSVQIQRVSPIIAKKEMCTSQNMKHKDGTHHSEESNVSSCCQPTVLGPNTNFSMCSSEDQAVSITSVSNTSPASLVDSGGSLKSSPSDTECKENIAEQSHDHTQQHIDKCRSTESLNHPDTANRHRKAVNLSPSISSSTQSLHSINSMPGDTSEMDGRVSKWAHGFDKLMEDQAGLHCFEEFLKKEFSEENIVFWIACEDFRMISDTKKLKVTAANIFETHLGPHATMPVNIDSSAVKLAEEHLANPTSDMYQLQQQQVYTLMKFDSYPRFLKSDLYRQCLMCEADGLTLPYEEADLDDKVNKSRLFKKQQSGRSWGRRSSKKSSSSYDESKTPGEKMRSLLPWKGKQARKASRPFDSQPSSARSSISSLSDSLPNISNSMESLEGRRENECMHFCRIVLPDHSSTIVTAKHGQTLLESLTHLCERRHMSLASMGVYLGATDKPAQPKDLEVDMSTMSNKEVILEHRSLFRLELPSGQVLGIKTKPEQSVRSCIEPILNRHKIDYNSVTIHVAGCTVPLDSGVPVASIEHQDVIVEINDQNTESNADSSRISTKPPPGFSTGARRGSRRGSGWEDSIFDDIARGKKQSLGNGYFDETGVWVPGLKPFRSQESLGDSFGKSFLRGPGLFGRKRKEAMENEKVVTVKAGQVLQKNSDVKEMMELLSRAQAQRLDDQRGELGKDALQLPDFLRLPENPTLPHTGDQGKDNVRPVIRKTVSSPAIATGQANFVNELTARLTRRTEQNPISENMERNEVNDRTGSEALRIEEPYSPWEPRKDNRRINVVRPRACTDGAVFKVEAVTPVRLSSDSRFEYHTKPTKLVHSESEPNIVQPRTHDAAQPLTVNSIRGFYASAGNVRQASTDGGRERVVLPPKSTNKLKYANRNPSASSIESSRNAPYVYEALPNEIGSIPEHSRSTGKIRDISNAKEARLRGPYYLPEANSDKSEVHVPSRTMLNRYLPTLQDRKSRPRPITDQSSVIMGLEEDWRGSHSAAGEPNTRPVLSPTVSEISSSSGSPLPLPPSPIDGVELDIADFPPPTPICPVTTGARSRLSRIAADTPDLDNTITPVSANERTLSGEDDTTPLAVNRPYINMRQGDGTPLAPNKPYTSTRQGDGTSLASNKPYTSTRQGDGTSLAANKPYTSTRQGDDTSLAAKKPYTSARQGVGRSKGDSRTFVPRLDPYVTYESDDLRITFV